MRGHLSSKETVWKEHHLLQSRLIMHQFVPPRLLWRANISSRRWGRARRRRGRGRRSSRRPRRRRSPESCSPPGPSSCEKGRRHASLEKITLNQSSLSTCEFHSLRMPEGFSQFPLARKWYSRWKGFFNKGLSPPALAWYEKGSLQRAFW